MLFLVIERKESKGSITDSGDIITADAPAAITTTSVATAVVAPRITTTIVHEENEKTGETTDVSDKSK